MQRAQHEWRAGCILQQSSPDIMRSGGTPAQLEMKRGARHSTFCVPIINALPPPEGGIVFGRQV
jgi:hypothetical protein